MNSCSAAPSIARTLALEQLEPRERTAEGRAEVDARRAIAHRAQQLAGVRHTDLRGPRAGIAERLLQLVGDDDARQLVVEPQGQPVAGDREEADEERDRRGAAEPVEQTVEVLE